MKQDQTVAERRVYLMTAPQASAFDLLQAHGLPATLDALAFVCYTLAQWHREDREPKLARKFDRFADRLHKLSLTTER